MSTRTTKKKTLAPKVQKVVFQYFAPEAKEVCLAGSFNQWMDRELFLKKDKFGNWKTLLPLGSGRYEYRFIVDGNWVNAQEKGECVPNSFGTWNSVLQVQG